MKETINNWTDIKKILSGYSFMIREGILGIDKTLQESKMQGTLIIDKQMFELTKDINLEIEFEIKDKFEV